MESVSTFTFTFAPTPTFFSSVDILDDGRRRRCDWRGKERFGGTPGGGGETRTRSPGVCASFVPPAIRYAGARALANAAGHDKNKSPRVHPYRTQMPSHAEGRRTSRWQIRIVLWRPGTASDAFAMKAGPGRWVRWCPHDPLPQFPRGFPSHSPLLHRPGMPKITRARTERSV